MKEAHRSVPDSPFNHKPEPGIEIHLAQDLEHIGDLIWIDLANVELVLSQ